MKSVFISGIPTSGKSYLAKKVAKKTNSIYVDIDSLKIEMEKDPELKFWVNFFRDKNENEYWKNITPEKHWDNLVKQSEAFWPKILQKIREIQKTNKSAIFEGVNLLPHLVSRDLDFAGIILLGDSEKTVLERCIKNPRWGTTIDLQKKEAKWFFVHEGKKYEEEAKKYGYKVFRDSKKAEKELMKLLER